MSLNPEQIKSILISSTAETLPAVLDTIYASQHCFEHEKTIISTINNRLKSEKTRLRAFELLQTSIPYCSLEALSENAANWSNYCIPHPTEPNKDIKLKILTKILNNTGHVETFHKKFQSEHLPSVLKLCVLYRNEAEQEACISCLIECMKRYPSWFGSHKGKIETLVLRSLDSPNVNLVRSASVCFLSLLQTGSSGEGGVNYVNNFSSNFGKMCATVQSLFDEFFEDFMETDGARSGEVFTFKEGENPKSKDLVSRRVVNCIRFIKTLIVKQFPVEKRIILKDVADVINRGLSWHVCTSEPHVSLDAFNQSLLLKKIQLELLKLSQILVKAYRHSLLPFGFVLKRSLVNVLKNISKCRCLDYDVSFVSHLYETINSWLLLNGNFNDSQLAPALLNNIRPQKKTTLLAHGGGIEGSQSSKKRDLLAEISCLSSLDTLRVLLETSSSDQKVVQEVIRSVVALLADISSNRVVAPYTNENCQAKLYEVLISVLRGEDLEVFPSLHLIIGILSRGSNNGNWKIARISREGLDFVEKICHPVCVGLSADIPAPKPSLENLLVDEEVREETGPEDEVEENVEDLTIVEKISEESVEVAEKTAEPETIMVEDEPPNHSPPREEDAGSEEMFSTFQDVV